MFLLPLISFTFSCLAMQNSHWSDVKRSIILETLKELLCIPITSQTTVADVREYLDHHLVRSEKLAFFVFMQSRKAVLLNNDVLIKEAMKAHNSEQFALKPLLPPVINQKSKLK